jgi:hypothetical protein
VRISADVSSFCLAPSTIFVSPQLLEDGESGLPSEREPELAIFAWLLALHHANFGQHAPLGSGPTASREADFVTGCTLSRMGLRGSVLSEQVETLLERTVPAGEGASEIINRRRALIASGVGACH